MDDRWFRLGDRGRYSVRIYQCEMAENSILILPGLDGTDLMLSPFARAIGSKRRLQISELPDNSQMDYSDLAAHFADRLSGESSVHIIAESFSGPVGVLVARRLPYVVRRLTLVASFICSPVSRLTSLIPWLTLFRMPMPSWVASRYFVGDQQHLIPTLQNAVKRHRPETLRHRMRLVQSVDVSPQYSELTCELNYLQPLQDRMIPSHCIEKILLANPTTDLRQIDGPHLILQTNPSGAWDAIWE